MTPLLRAKDIFEKILKESKSEIVRDATILRFEFVFELTWKMFKKVLRHRGIEVNSPREVYRVVAREGLIEDPKVWFIFLENRSKATHIYDELMAEEIYLIMPVFKQELDKLVQTLLKL